MGRKIVIMEAMAKDSVEKKIKDETVNADKRNMRLIKIGLLNTNDFKQTERVSDEDMKLRVKLYKEKEKGLKKNPNLFISETRLCVRNLPKNYSDSELRQIIEFYLEDWKHNLTHEERKSMDLRTKRIIHQVKVLKEQADEGDAARPKGIGFVELEHP